MYIYDVYIFIYRRQRLAGKVSELFDGQALQVGAVTGICYKRKSDIDIDIDVYIYVYLCTCMYIYIYL